MESRMAGVNYTTLGTSATLAYDLPSSWQLKVVGAIFTWLILAQLTAFTKHLRAWVQPFVLRHVESGVPVIVAIQVPVAHYHLRD
jgi:sphingosine-1-phosphate phosphatase 1